MDGLGGKAGWCWIFIIEGLLTVVVAGISFITLVEFPDRAQKSFRFLKQREIEWVLRRVQNDRGDAIAEPFTLSKFLRAGRDLKLWFLGVIFTSVFLSFYITANSNRYLLQLSYDGLLCRFFLSPDHSP